MPDPNTTIDPGLLIAKDIVVKAEDIGPDGSASGHMEFNIGNVEYLGGADIRGMLAQGDYYLNHLWDMVLSFLAFMRIKRFYSCRRSLLMHLCKWMERNLKM